MRKQMSYKEVKARASRGPFEANNSFYISNHQGDDIADTYSDYPPDAGEHEATARLIGHTLNHFDAVLEALEEGLILIHTSPQCNGPRFFLMAEKMSKALKDAQTVEEGG